MRPLVVCAMVVLSLPAGGQETHSDTAREKLVQGVEAFKAGHYAEATNDFQAAVDTEPEWKTARLYLGTALAYEVVPNLDTPDNVAIADRALAQFNQILATDPQALDAMRQVASIQRKVKRIDDALATERRILAIDPNDAEAHYTIGVIEWTKAYKFTVMTLGDESLQDDGNGNPRLSAAGCTALVANNSSLVEDGIAQLTRAIELRPTYDDAMQYLNLMYRQRASLDCSDAAQRERDLATANEWIQRSIGARKANEQQKLQQSGNPLVK